MPVVVESPDMVALVRKLGAVSADAPKAFSQAIMSVGRASKTETTRAGAAIYNASTRRIGEAVKVDTSQNTAFITGKKKPITARSYGAKQTAKGVRVKVIKTRGMKLIRGGFSPKKFNGVPFQRLGRSRFPIAPIVGPSVADMLNNELVFKPLQVRLVTRASDELNRRITRALASG